MFENSTRKQQKLPSDRILGVRLSFRQGQFLHFALLSLIVPLRSKNQSQLIELSNDDDVLGIDRSLFRSLLNSSNG